MCLYWHRLKENLSWHLYLYGSCVWNLWYLVAYFHILFYSEFSLWIQLNHQIHYFWGPTGNYYQSQSYKLIIQMTNLCDIFFQFNEFAAPCIYEYKNSSLNKTTTIYKISCFPLSWLYFILLLVLIICNAFFAPGVLPYIGYIGMCGAKGFFLFLAVLVWNRVSISTIWSEIGYGLCTLVLNWLCVLEEATLR